MSFLVLEKITKRYGRTVAVDGIDLEVGKGELVVLLGPSGCGKTTVLKIIAGLLFPDEGRVVLDGKDITYAEPGERDVAMVFQDYALYPHMSVFDNIAFPLTIKKKKLGLAKDEIANRVYKVAKMLGIEELLSRKPTQLSGGQQQRVALARALVAEPKIWLMDEPLSNLDALIRVYVRAELKKLQKDLGITTVYVTHDQVEALTLADKVAVMSRGRVIQVGTPKEVYESPEHIFVATFVGSPPMNIIECKVSEKALTCPGFAIDMSITTTVKSIETGLVYLGIRPEDIEVYEKPVEQTIEGRIYVIENLGSEYIINIKLGDTLIKAKTLKEIKLSSGDPIYFKPNWRKISIFDKQSEKIIKELTETIRELNKRKP